MKCFDPKSKKDLWAKRGFGYATLIAADGKLLATAGSAGHAMTITTLVMVAGFTVLALAAIKSIVYFGLLVALAMIAALLTDLLLLPALLSLRGNHGYR